MATFKASDEVDMVFGDILEDTRMKILWMSVICATGTDEWTAKTELLMERVEQAYERAQGNKSDRSAVTYGDARYILLGFVTVIKEFLEEN